MAENAEIALVIWVDDDPVRFGIIRVGDILEPRREFTDYHTGETVTARCRGYKGTYKCLIARIGGTSEKAKFEQQIVSNFADLFEEFGLACPYIDEPEKEENSKELEGGIGKQVTSSKKVSAKETKKRSSPRKNPTPKKRPQRSNLVQIANDLDLTELEAEPVLQPLQNLESDVDAPAAKQQCTSSVIGKGLMTLNYEDSPIKGTTVEERCSCECRTEIDTLKQQASKFEQDFNAVWYWINMLHNNSQQQAWSSRNSVFHGQGDMMAGTPTRTPKRTPPSTPSATVTYSELTKGQRDMTASDLPQELSARDLPVELSTSVTTYGGFTKAQLLEVVSSYGIRDFSKAAKKLFRILYKKEEYVGRSLTGTSSNKQYESRPGLEDSSKMNIIYEIMNEKFNASPVQVREKLRDLVKPSKARQSFVY